MELLAPAGGMEQLRAAVRFGADAVYLAADRFGMRARAANFALEDIPAAVEYAHAHGVKVHVTCNVLMFPDDIDALPPYLRALDAAEVDALIIGDMGAFALAREHAPHVDLHVSTQASVANAAAARVWHSLGARRVVCAREMSLADIARLRQDVPPDLEIEAFAHGAMCMAVSGRCLISSYLTGRSGNKGHCTQPCRWSYQLGELVDGGGLPAEDEGCLAQGADGCSGVRSAGAESMADAGAKSAASLCAEGATRKAGLPAQGAGSAGASFALEEEKRPGEFFPIEQDGRGTFIMNAKDLNMIAHLRELEVAGVNSIKIEGRNKKAFYVATVVGAYRRALDGAPLEEIERELLAVSHRPYSTGFYFGEAEQAPAYDGYEQETMHVADVVGCEVAGSVEGHLAGGEAAADAGETDADEADAGAASEADAGATDVDEAGASEADSSEAGAGEAGAGEAGACACADAYAEGGTNVSRETIRVTECADASRVLLYARCRNRFAEGDVFEVLAPREAVRTVRVRNLTWLPDPTEDDPAPAPVPVPVANRSCNRYRFEAEGLAGPVQPGSFLRVRTFRRSARHG